MHRHPVAVPERADETPRIRCASDRKNPQLLDSGRAGPQLGGSAEFRIATHGAFQGHPADRNGRAGVCNAAPLRLMSHSSHANPGGTGDVGINAAPAVRMGRHMPPVGSANRLVPGRFPGPPGLIRRRRVFNFTAQHPQARVGILTGDVKRVPQLIDLANAQCPDQVPMTTPTNDLGGSPEQAVRPPTPQPTPSMSATRRRTARANSNPPVTCINSCGYGARSIAGAPS